MSGSEGELADGKWSLGGGDFALVEVGVSGGAGGWADAHVGESDVAGVGLCEVPVNASVVCNGERCEFVGFGHGEVCGVVDDGAGDESRGDGFEGDVTDVGVSEGDADPVVTDRAGVGQCGEPSCSAFSAATRARRARAFAANFSKFAFLCRSSVSRFRAFCASVIAARPILSGFLSLHRADASRRHSGQVPQPRISRLGYSTPCFEHVSCVCCSACNAECASTAINSR